MYVTGYFSWNLIDFDPGPLMDYHGSIGNEDGFVTKYLSTGEYQWTRTWGGAGNDMGSEIAADGDGNAYVTGSYSHEVDFNPGLGTEYHTADGAGDAYLLKIPPDGNW